MSICRMLGDRQIRCVAEDFIEHIVGFTPDLTGAGPIPGPLYDTVVARLGQQALDAMVFVTIHYLALGALLNAYDVSVPAENSTERK